MILASRSWAISLGVTAFCLSAAAIGAQLYLHIPFALSGPAESLDRLSEAALIVLAIVLAIVQWSRGRSAALGWLALTVVFACDLEGASFDIRSRIVSDDIPTLIGWLVTGMGIVPIVASRRWPVSVRVMLGLGLALQSIAFLGDLGDGSVFKLPGVSSGFVSDFGEGLELFYLASYLSGLALLVSSLQRLDALMRPEGGETTRTWVRWLYGVTEMDAVRRLEILRGRLAFQIHRWRHPNADFAHYYARNITRKLDRGTPHRTLGVEVWGKDRFLASSGPRLAGFHNEGLAIFNGLRRQGVAEDSRVVDYGCGSLRIGQHFIRWLKAGQYWGLDVTDRFYRDGIEMLDTLEPGLVAAKMPRFRIIGPATLSEALRARPDLVFSVAVMKHVPPGELMAYWRNILSLVARHGRAVVHFTRGDREVRTDSKGWAYPADAVRTIVEQLLPGAIVQFQDLGRSHRIRGCLVRRSSITVEPPQAPEGEAEA